ncbi:hypothetical protein BC629DRAFT_1592072 [Irpex lacteus]|nr:hypothetical protein BC629DRAFT_1592072 [Irpex lacteus]
MKLLASTSSPVRIKIPRRCPVAKALRAPDVDGSYLAVHVELINRISSFEYPFRHALFSKNVIWFVTSALVKFGETLSSTNDNTLVDAMISCFGYLCNYLESTDGFTWVLQAVRAGLLQAFCDCSTKFDIIPKEDLNIILGLFKVKLPRYLVYRSVLDVIENSMEKVDRDPHQKRISNSIAKQTWYDFRRLAQERIAITYQVLSEARLVCDNVKCQKFGTKDVMRACAACMNTYYCSKQCQASAWKDGDHKTMCKMQQRHRLGVSLQPPLSTRPDVYIANVVDKGKVCSSIKERL